VQLKVPFVPQELITKLQKKWWHRLMMVLIWILFLASILFSIFYFLEARYSETKYVFSYQEDFDLVNGVTHEITSRHKNVGGDLVIDILLNGHKYADERVQCMYETVWKYNTPNSGWINFGKPLKEILQNCYINEKLEFKTVYITPNSAYLVLLLPLIVAVLMYILYFKIFMYVIFGRNPKIK